MPDRISLSPQAQAIIRRLRRLPTDGMQAAARALDAQNRLTADHIIRQYLSFPRGGPVIPYGLRTQTGALRRSVRPNAATVSASAIHSSIGGTVTRKGVNYLAVHEYGAHHNARPPLPGRKRSKGMKAWDAPARGMIQRGIQDRLAETGAAVSQAIVDNLEGKSA